MNVLSILKYLSYAYLSSVLLFPLASVYQEAKIWRHPLVPTLSPVGKFKVYIFNVFWMGLSLLGCVILLPKYLLKGCSGVEHDMNTLVERLTAFVVVSCFTGPVKVIGREKLPPEGTPCVYIANHASQIDVGVAYFIFRRFSWIAKKSVVYLPGVGTVLLMGGHVFIDRYSGKHKSSARRMYETARIRLQEDKVPIFIFPQGTRRMVERLPFKDGAFNIAMTSEVPIVPMSIEIPLQAWNDWYPLSLLWGVKKEPVVLTIHDRIEVTKDSDKEKLKEKAYEIIHSVLPNREDGKKEN